MPYIINNEGILEEELQKKEVVKNNWEDIIGLVNEAKSLYDAGELTKAQAIKRLIGELGDLIDKKQRDKTVRKIEGRIFGERKIEKEGEAEE